VLAETPRLNCIF